MQGLSEGQLVSRFGDGVKPGGGRWLYRIARGVCLDAVHDRQLAHSRGSGKNFARGKEGPLTDWGLVEVWLDKIASQVLPRPGKDCKDYPPNAILRDKAVRF